MVAVPAGPAPPNVGAKNERPENGPDCLGYESPRTVLSGSQGSGTLNLLALSHASRKVQAATNLTLLVVGELLGMNVSGSHRLG